jgi:transposase-like protein
MSNKRYPEEFKIEAVKQITERGQPSLPRISWNNSLMLKCQIRLG